jgi:hypothetical protein
MPVSQRGNLKTVSLVLTKEQVRRMTALAALRSSEHRTVGLSEVAKEVVEAGLKSISHTPISSFDASNNGAEAAVA